jgi:hypothetical protein
MRNFVKAASAMFCKVGNSGSIWSAVAADRSASPPQNYKNLPTSVYCLVKVDRSTVVYLELSPVTVIQTPFDTVENAHQYVRLLAETIAEAKNEIAADLGAADHVHSERRRQALQIVQFKLDKLEQHLQSSSRLLNDLRTLRRLPLEERPEPATSSPNRNSAA